MKRTSKKNCALPFVALCLMQNHKLPTARRAATQARETRLGDRVNSTVSLGELFHPAGSPAAFYAD
jgi:hypothetical protein